MRGANGIIIVYSVTDETSFRRVKYWMDKIEGIGETSVPLLLVGNKSDCNERVSSFENLSSI